MANNTLRIAELDFDNIKSNLKEFLKNQDEFDGYNFEGDGMDVLLDVLAYNTYYNSFYLNMIGNEMFLDTAQKRASVISHAKSLNYTPRSQTGATAKVNIKVTPSALEDNSATTLTLSRYTKFISEPIEGINYPFVAINTNVATKDANGYFYFANVSLQQGELVRNAYLVSGSERRYLIPTANVDTETVEVSVQESASNTETKIYTVNEDVTELRSNSQVFFLEESTLANGNYVVYFGDNVLGQKPANGNIVILSYLKTEGDYANDANSFVLLETIGGYNDNVTITPVVAAYAGAQRETVEEIRTRAPIHYTVQNRAVIDRDYAAIILRDYPNIEAVSVWGGEDNNPPVYGKVFISMKPVRNFEISNLEKERIKDEIIRTKSVLGITPEIIDPDYTYLIVKMKVFYDPRKTTMDENSLKSVIRDAVTEFKDDNLRNFESNFYKSQLVRKVEDVNRAIISCSADVYLQKRIEPDLDVSKNYTIDFGVPLLRGGISDKLYTSPTFTLRDADNIERLCYLEEVPESYTGIDHIHVTDAGSGYTSAPTVSIVGDGSGATAEAHIVNGRITDIEVTERGSNYTRATVTLSGGGGTGGAAVIQLQAKFGTLQVYYIKSNGEKSYISEDIGDINYITGEINLKDIEILDITSNPNYNSGVLTINIQPEEDNITPERNNILDIDENDASSILIEMVPEI